MYQQQLFKVIEPIKINTIKRLNKSKKWEYGYNKENDIARISVPVKTTSDSLEAFSIAFEENDKNITMHMGWDTIRVAVPFKKVQ